MFSNFIEAVLLSSLLRSNSIFMINILMGCTNSRNCNTSLVTRQIILFRMKIYFSDINLQMTVKLLEGPWSRNYVAKCYFLFHLIINSLKNYCCPADALI